MIVTALGPLSSVGGICAALAGHEAFTDTGSSREFVEQLATYRLPLSPPIRTTQRPLFLPPSEYPA